MATITEVDPLEAFMDVSLRWKMARKLGQRDNETVLMCWLNLCLDEHNRRLLCDADR